MERRYWMIRPLARCRQGSDSGCAAFSVSTLWVRAPKVFPLLSQHFPSTTVAWGSGDLAHQKEGWEGERMEGDCIYTSNLQIK